MDLRDIRFIYYELSSSTSELRVLISVSAPEEDVREELKALKEELRHLKEELRAKARTEPEEPEEAQDERAGDQAPPNEQAKEEPRHGDRPPPEGEEERRARPARMIFSKSDDGSKMIIDIGSMGEIMEEVVNGIKGEIQKSIFVGTDKIMVATGRGKDRGDVDEALSSKVFAALGNEHRVRILKEMATGGMYASELEARIPVSASTLSSHLKTLEEAGLIAQEAVRGRYLLTLLGRRALRWARGFSQGD